MPEEATFVVVSRKLSNCGVMATNGSSGNVWWFITRRCGVYLLLGTLIGAVWGAIYIGLAGAFIGGVEEATDWTNPNFALVGGLFGVGFGAITGGAVGLFGWAIIGIIAPPGRSLWPPKTLARPMLHAMGIATILATIFYFMWCAIFGWLRNGFVDAFQDGLLYALFGVPALMGLGQIIGIWHGASKLHNSAPESEAVSN